MPITKTTRKKDGLQGYRVRVNYIDTDGNYAQIERTAYGKDAARLLEIELTQQINAAPEKTLTLDALFAEYWQHHAHEVKETTIKKLQDTFRLYIAPYLSNIKLDRLTARKLTEWKTEIVNRKLSHATNKRAFDALRALLNYGVKMRYIENNPLLNVGTFKKPLEVKKDMAFYTPAQFKDYINIAS